MKKTEVIIYLILVFIAGAITGSVVTLRVAHPQRPQMPSTEEMTKMINGFLKKELNLTESQQATVAPIVQLHAQKMGLIHSNSVDQMNALFRASNLEISKCLDTQQKARLEELDQERQQKWNRGH